MPKIYLASPLGFSEAGRHFYTSVLIPFVAGLGCEILDPWSLTDSRRIDAVQRLPYGPEKRDAWRTLNREIGATNRAAIDAAETITSNGRRLHLRIAVDYSSREALLRAACRMYTATEVTAASFSRLLTGICSDCEPSPDVDLLIRTGGEQRLSDFLLWECAYAELYFTQTPWPDFAEGDLRIAMRTFLGRERTYGAEPQAAVAS